jgi:hypothetical protein
MFQPPPVPPGTESWGERYGPIGVVAALALAALIFSLIQFLRERKEDRTQAAKAAAEHDKQVAALYDKIVTIARENNEQNAKLNAEHNLRYQSLLERTMQDNRSNIEILRAQNAATTDALSALVRKLQRGGDG